MKIEKQLFYRNVSTLDFAYVVSEKRIIGCSLYVDVQFSGAADSDGVIYDFSIAKNKVKNLVDEYIDHRLIVPAIIVNEVDGDRYHVTVGDIEYTAPKQAFCLIAEVTEKFISYKDIEKLAEKIIIEELPENISFVKVNLREEEGKQPFFSYTHGLKNHYGNCQRLLHGHRNPLEIWTSGVRRGDLESQFIKKYLSSDVHFVFLGNIINRAEIWAMNSGEIPIGLIDSSGTVLLEYSSIQGQFSLKIPVKNCYFVDQETTIENVAAKFLEHIVLDSSIDDDITVIAYEGIGKGSICLSS